MRERTRPIWWSPAVGVGGSLAAHVALYLLLGWAGTAPTVDFEIVLPTSIELGLAEGAALPAEPAEATPAEPAPAAEPGDTPAPDAPEPAREPDATVPVEKPDAGVTQAAPDAAVSTDAGLDAATPTPGEGPSDAGPAASGDAGRPLLAELAPPGAQLALRLHLGGVRVSPLADDVARLLAAIPDWKLILDGSGIDPLRDLERLFLASPNLDRASLVIAGQYLGDASLPRRAVQQLARARGAKARWRMRGGVATAPWHDLDATERAIALIGPEQFVITRPEDLPRVVAIARALAERQARETGSAPSNLATALLALGPGELLAISVEGVRHFVRGRERGVPERLEASVRESDDEPPLVELHATGVFTTPEAAAEGARYWSATRDRFARHPLVALVGMDGPLARAELEVVGERLQARTRLTLLQASRILGFLRDAFTPPPTR